MSHFRPSQFCQITSRAGKNDNSTFFFCPYTWENRVCLLEFCLFASLPVASRIIGKRKEKNIRNRFLSSFPCVRAADGGGGNGGLRLLRTKKRRGEDRGRSGGDIEIDDAWKRKKERKKRSKRHYLLLERETERKKARFNLSRFDATYVLHTAVSPKTILQLQKK